MTPGEADQRQQHRDHDLARVGTAARAESADVLRAPRAGPARRRLSGCGALAGGSGRARGVGSGMERCLRIAATLEKIRIPRTTMTPVDSWPPTPSWSPRKTIAGGDDARC